MTVLAQIPFLAEALAPGTEILTNSEEPVFQDFLRRWSDIDKQTPAAIVLPQTEEDVQKTVQWAINASIPFVAKSGGHSTWSTIGKTGVVIDLSRYSGVEVDAIKQTATIKGSVLAKDVAVALGNHGLFPSLGNGNTVGAIPFVLNGGIPLTPSLTGFGSDNIISARVVTAKGELLEVTEETYPDLLFAIRGAGQFFGLVTQLVIVGHPFSTLGNDAGTVWVGTFIFGLDAAEAVCKVMEGITSDSTYDTSGLLMVMAPPDQKPVLLVSARCTGPTETGPQAFKGLYDMVPAPRVAIGSSIPYANTSDGREALAAKGDFKLFGIVGLHNFSTSSFLGLAKLWTEMVKECPDAIRTSFNFQWNSRPVKKPGFESAMSHHDIRFWALNIIWHTNPANRTKIDEYNSKAIAVMRAGSDSGLVDYQNGTRNGPIERRFRNEAQLARLKALKKQWDPKGVFTNELLE